MRGTVAKMLRRQVHSAPAELKMEYSQQPDCFGLPKNLPLTFRYPKHSAQSDYTRLKRRYKLLGPAFFA